MTRQWTADDLQAIGGASELQLASRRRDGSLRPFVTIWVVRVGDELYVRSGYGRENPWFRRALLQHAGRVRAGGLEIDVLFEETGSELVAQVNEAYHAKYDRFGAADVDPMVSALAAAATFRLVPAPTA